MQSTEIEAPDADAGVIARTILAAMSAKDILMLVAHPHYPALMARGRSPKGTPSWKHCSVAIRLHAMARLRILTALGDAR